MVSMLGRRNERAIVVVIVFITIATIIAFIHFDRRINNQKLLYYQLQALRTSVNLFKAIEERNPKNFLELATSEYKFPGEDQRHRYLEGIAVEGDGSVRDPFGGAFEYDAAKGWVKSTSSGYELW